MQTNNYYDDRRFCDACGSYMRFLQSPSAAYCAECGGRVRIFSPGDMATFRSSLASKRVQAVDRDTSAGARETDEGARKRRIV